MRSPVFRRRRDIVRRSFDHTVVKLGHNTLAGSIKTRFIIAQKIPNKKKKNSNSISQYYWGDWTLVLTNILIHGRSRRANRHFLVGNITFVSSQELNSSSSGGGGKAVAGYMKPLPFEQVYKELLFPIAWLSSTYYGGFWTSTQLDAILV